MDEDFFKMAEDFLTDVSNDTNKYTSQKAVIKRNANNNSVEMYTPDYLQFAYAGRGAGKAPPLERILSWVKKKNIVSDAKQQIGTAFAIMKTIAKKGTKNYKPNADNILETSINKYLSKYYNGISASIFKVQTEEITKILNDTYNKNTKFKF